MDAVVVETGLGNVRSVEKALETAAREQGLAAARIARSADPDRIRRADRLIVPGQGGFGEGARALSGALGEVLRERLSAGVPYLGICLGLQLLFEASEEAEGRGLGWFRGAVRALQPAPGIKIPHMGWNQLELSGGGHPCLEAAGGQGAWVYFVHSYHAVPADPDVLKAACSFGPNRVTAAVARDNVLATQFHPEKSQQAGLRLLGAFLRG